jgi:hypothetical protein
MKFTSASRITWHSRFSFQYRHTFMLIKLFAPMRASLLGADVPAIRCSS